MGKVVIIAILLAAVLGGVGIWYTANYAFWKQIEGPVTLTILQDKTATPLAVSDVQAITSTSSPLGFRACFAHTATPDQLATSPREGAAPTVPPSWFDCFDAGAIGGLLASGDAIAYTAYKNVAFGIDRIVALTPDGRGWAWHELNDCGAKAYDGTATAPACPDRATFQPLTEGQ